MRAKSVKRLEDIVTKVKELQLTPKPTLEEQVMMADEMHRVITGHYFTVNEELFVRSKFESGQ